MRIWWLINKIGFYFDRSRLANLCWFIWISKAYEWKLKKLSLVWQKVMVFRKIFCCAEQPSTSTLTWIKASINLLNRIRTSFMIVFLNSFFSVNRSGLLVDWCRTFSIRDCFCNNLFCIRVIGIVEVCTVFCIIKSVLADEESKGPETFFEKYLIKCLSAALESRHPKFYSSLEFEPQSRSLL